MIIRVNRLHRRSMHGRPCAACRAPMNRHEEMVQVLDDSPEQRAPVVLHESCANALADRMSEATDE